MVRRPTAWHKHWVLTPGEVTMLRLFLTFAWFKWRLVTNQIRNTLDKGGAVWLVRVAQPVVSVLLVLFIVPAFIAVAALSLVVGWALGRGHIHIEEALVPGRWVLLFSLIWILLLPLAFGGRGAVAQLARLCLLPIHPRVLHAVQYLVVLADPFFLPGVVALLTFPVGLLLAGEVALSLTAAAGGALLALALAGIGCLTTSLLQLMLRQRRRSETVSIALTAGTLLAALPFFLMVEEAEANNWRFEEWTTSLWFLNLPAELFVQSYLAVSNQRGLTAAFLLVVLAGVGAGLYSLSERAHRRVLATVAVGAGRRGRPGKSPADRWPTLPGVPVSVAAVAGAQVRCFLRTMVGKLLLILGPLILAIVGGAVRFGLVERWDKFPVPMALVLIYGGLVLSYVNLAQFMFNQFAVDGAGATLARLLPLSTYDLIRGKTVAWGLLLLLSLVLAAIPTVLLTTPPLGEALASFALVLLAGLSMLLLMAPVGAALSAVLPKKVDLSKFNNQAQPHNLALLAGHVCIGFSGCVPVVLILVAMIAPARPVAWGLAFLLVLLWNLVAVAFFMLLLRPTASLVDRCRESILVTTAAG